MNRRLHVARTSMRAVALVTALVANAACGRPEGAAREVEPVYDTRTGRLTLLRYDANHNGVSDTFSYMDGRRILRVEVDSDEDGGIDRWEHYGPDASLERVGFSRGRNGREDAWSYADAEGRVVRVEIDTRGDGRTSRIEHFDVGLLARVEEDSDGDGTFDRWEEYDGGRLTRLAMEPDQTGTPMRTLVYRADGSVQVHSPGRIGAQP